MTAGVRVGIDASNLREGGGRTHLVEMLAHADAHLGRVTSVTVWGARDTLALLPRRPWIEPRHERLLDGPLPARLGWERAVLPRRARAVDVVFAPGGRVTSGPRPTVTMSQNLLPFDDRQRRRYRGALRAKLELLRVAQARSFARADAVIFLTDHARRTVIAAMGREPRRAVTIPHGVGTRFRGAAAARADGPLRLLYVSTISLYKQQLELVEAVAALARDVPVSLALVGPDDGTDTVRLLRAAIARLDPRGELVSYAGRVPFPDVDRHYRACDIFVFPSACENLPIALLEAMAGGLAIASSNAGPMPEVLGDAGVYFDPMDRASMVAALRELAADPVRRAALGERARARSAAFTWERCARSTFALLGEVA